MCKHFCIHYKYRESEKTKGIKLILDILNNIINNASEISKYDNLNFHEINEKLSMCPPALQLLFIAGFNVEDCKDNKSRLIWRNTTENMIKMRNIYSILSMKKILIMNKDEMNTFICLINAGYTNEEAINAINLSIGV